MKTVILINLGGPRNKDEIEKFLLDLFTDPLVFDLPIPEFFRIRLARFIAKKRAPKVAANYAAMGFGGGSPLFDETMKQANALEKVLITKTNQEWKVIVSMACGFPHMSEIPKETWTSKDTIVLPLFPHYSRSTTMSIAKLIEKFSGQCPTNQKIGSCGNSCGYSSVGKICPMDRKNFVAPFHTDPKFIESSVELILDYLNGRLLKKDFLHLDNTKEIPDWKNIPVLFSAHGIPIRLINKGDIYRNEIESNLKNITAELRKKGYQGEVFLSFQSRVGPAKWTEPNTIIKLKELGKTGIKRIAIFPISFVSDHLETLEEIGEELKHVANDSGIQEYYRIPAHGIYPKFINALSELVLKNY